MNLDKVLHISTYAGRILLENGAEIYRVEDTIVRICKAYGVNNVDSFATPTGIIVSVADEFKTSSIVKRIKVRRVDLDKIHLINDLCRNINSRNIPIDEFYDKLVEINNKPTYPLWISIFFAAIASGSFAVLFGGTYNDFIGAFIIGLIIKAISIKFTQASINDFFINFIGGAITAFVALLLSNMHIISNIDKTIIGAIMLLVPGIAITNAIRDIIAGDYLAGLTKCAEALMIAVAIAAGTGTILSLWSKIIGGLF